MRALLPCCYDCPHQLKERSNFWCYSYSNTKTGTAPDARFCLEMWWKNWKALIWENPAFKTCLCHLLCTYLFWSRPFLDGKDRHPVKLAQVKSGFYCRIHEAISQAGHQNQKLFSLILSFWLSNHTAQYGHQLWLHIKFTPISQSSTSRRRTWLGLAYLG